jgi:ABC-type phosphate transport system permease subunit
MAAIQYLVQSHLLGAVVVVLVGRVIMEAREEEGVIAAVLVGLARAGKEIMAVMVVLMVAVAVAEQVVLVVTPLAHKTEVMEGQVHLQAFLVLA